MHADTLPTVTIIGPGRVGKTLGRVLVASGAARILDVAARSLESAENAVRFIGAGIPHAGLDRLGRADIYLLGVPDDQIAMVCAQLVAAHALRAEAIIVHCSGALNAAVLQPARAADALIASVHPLRSFADPERVSADFAGTCCGIEGDDAALAALRPMLEHAGARLIGIDSAHKTLYHAAAVFASNYLVTLIDVAVQTYGQAGIARDAALQLIAPLLRESAENAFRLGPAAALTGPIARGDWQTVERQQRALAAWTPAHADLYAQLAQATAALAATREKTVINSTMDPDSNANTIA